jgi:hypothetical protein
MTYYEVLEIDSRASTDEVERAFRRLARKVHPDLNAGHASKAEARMKLLNEIRDILTDPLLRAGYDERLRLESFRERAAPPRRQPPAAEPTDDAPAAVRAAVIVDPPPAGRPAWAPTLLLVTVGVGGVAGAFALYPRLATHLDAAAPAVAPVGPLPAPDADVAPLLTTPVMGAAHAPEAAHPRGRARGRGAVHVGSSADDVLRLLGPPDGIDPGQHPGESVMRYGSLRLEMRNGRVVDGDAAAR